MTQFLWPTGRPTALQESIGKIFQGVWRHAWVAEGLELPSTGWQSRLLLPQRSSGGPFLGLLLEPWCLAQRESSLQPPASCPGLSLPQGAIRGPIPTSLPAQRLAVDTLLQGRPLLGRRAGVLGASSLSSISPCPSEAFRLWGPLEHVDDALIREV